MNKKIVITIPAYNEEKSIGGVINDIKKVMSRLTYKHEVIVVDDGSKDNTIQIAKKAGAIVIPLHYHLGLAEAYRAECKEALKRNADIIVHTDADGQYLAKEIPKLIQEVENGHDLVLGSRFLGKIESMPLTKRLGNKAFSMVISGIIGHKIYDAQTGFRAYNKNIAKLDIISNYSYTQESIIRAFKEHYKIKEVPVYFAKRDGKSRLMKNPFEYAIKAWINIFRIYRDYEPLKFFGLFGGIFFLLGFFVGLWLFYLFLTTGIVGHYPSIMLSVLLMSIGLQIWLFGFLADMKKN